MIYSAYIYLTQEIPNGLGGLSVPVFKIKETESLDSLLSYIKKLKENKVIQAYRVIYSVDNGKNWYNDSWVEFLAEGKTVIGIE